MIKLSEWEQIVVGLVISLLTFLQTKVKSTTTITLSEWYEQFAVISAISVLTVIQSKIKNATALDGITAAVAFLNQLLNGQPVELAGIQAALAFLNQLVAGTVATA